jgi:ABC-type thiamin/hydroxymethylpyrimidine transport system permease subunit
MEAFYIITTHKMKYIQILFQINNISEVLAQNTESLYNKVYNLTRNFKSYPRRLISDLIFAFTKHKSVSLIQLAKFSYKNNLLNSNKNIVASYSKFLSGNTIEKLSNKYNKYCIKQLAKHNKTIFVAID